VDDADEEEEEASEENIGWLLGKMRTLQTKRCNEPDAQKRRETERQLLEVRAVKDNETSHRSHSH